MHNKQENLFSLSNVGWRVAPRLLVPLSQLGVNRSPAEGSFVSCCTSIEQRFEITVIFEINVCNLVRL